MFSEPWTPLRSPTCEAALCSSDSEDSKELYRETYFNLKELRERIRKGERE